MYTRFSYLLGLSLWYSVTTPSRIVLEVLTYYRLLYYPTKG